MIFANITSYIGLDASAEHYYCSTEVVPDSEPIPIKIYNGSSSNKDEEEHPLTAEEALILNKKDDTHRWREGRMSYRFSTIEQIHEHLKSKYKGQNIVSYEGGNAFNGMLYIIDGTDLGYEGLGEVWTDTPNGIWGDLIPETYIIKCRECGKIHKLENISTKSHAGCNGAPRMHVKFLRMSQIDKPCCKYMDLVWNVII